MATLAGAWPAVDPVFIVLRHRRSPTTSDDMMVHPRLFLFAATLLLFPLDAAVADEVKTCICPVTGEKVVQGDPEVASSEYRKATVYLCCNDCKKKFNADHKKFATKANMQLVATGQAKQSKCPISGEALSAEHSIVVKNVKVSFCCGNCQSKAEEAKGEKQLTLLFGNQAFERGFKVIAKGR